MKTLQDKVDGSDYHLSYEAVKKINSIIDDVDGPYSHLTIIDCEAVYTNSREVTAEQLFVEFKSALANHERAIFDDYVVSKLEKRGLINIRTIEYKLTEVDLEGMLTESSLTEIFDTYIKYEPCYKIRTEERGLDLQDLYIRFEKTLLADEHLIKHYANAIALSNTSNKNCCEEKPYQHLIIIALDNGNYLITPKPIAIK